MAAIEKQTIKLARTLTGAEAAGLKQNFLEQRGSDLTVDASDVDHLGAQCLQVMLAAAQTWRGEDRALTVEDASEGFSDCLSRYGVSLEELNAKGEAA